MRYLVASAGEVGKGRQQQEATRQHDQSRHVWVSGDGVRLGCCLKTGTGEAEQWFSCMLHSRTGTAGGEE